MLTASAGIVVLAFILLTGRFRSAHYTMTGSVTDQPVRRDPEIEESEVRPADDSRSGESNSGPVKSAADFDEFMDSLDPRSRR